jgi:hypothetical protein
MPDRITMGVLKMLLVAGDAVGPVYKFRRGWL